MADFIDEIDALAMASAGVKRLQLLELCDDVGLEVGRLMESGDHEKDSELAVAWKLRERDCKAIFAKSKRWGAGGPLRELESHLKSLAKDVEDQADGGNREPESSGACQAVMDSLEKTEKGAVRPTLGNISKILAEDPLWKGRLRLDTFADQLEFDGKPLQDADESEFSAWMGAVYGPDVSSARIHEAFVMVGRRNSYHPVAEYLDSLEWDGENRLDAWISDYIKADDTPLNRAYARRFLISMVARIRDPGCKVDTSLILFGPNQGERKSTALKALGGRWFSDTAIEIGSKDGYQALVGAWLVEVAELDSFAKRENSTVKAYLASAVDRFRPSYGRNQVTRPRQVVFCGSTNKDDFLNDDSGSRRFWVVKVGDEIDVEGLAAVRDQLFAEAVAAYAAGEKWWLEKSEELQRVKVAESYRPVDSWEPIVEAYLAGDPLQGIRPRSGPFQITFLLEVAIGLEAKDMGMAQSKRMASLLKRMGWAKQHTRAGNMWSKPD